MTINTSYNTTFEGTHSLNQSLPILIPAATATVITISIIAKKAFSYLSQNYLSNQSKSWNREEAIQFFNKVSTPEERIITERALRDIENTLSENAARIPSEGSDSDSGEPFFQFEERLEEQQERAVQNFNNASTPEERITADNRALRDIENKPSVNAPSIQTEGSDSDSGEPYFQFEERLEEQRERAVQSFNNASTPEERIITERALRDIENKLSENAARIPTDGSDSDGEEAY